MSAPTDIIIEHIAYSSRERDRILQHCWHRQ